MRKKLSKAKHLDALCEENNPVAHFYDNCDLVFTHISIPRNQQDWLGANGKYLSQWVKAVLNRSQTVGYVYNAPPPPRGSVGFGCLIFACTNLQVGVTRLSSNLFT